ncbi:MAG: formate transporter FocA [Pyrinomonadaceae bacterium]|nr:formate transporter FocA [Pyrinomonadaceae bacterium]
MAVRAEEIGVKKARLDFGSLFFLSVLAGAFIAFGAVFSTTIATSAGEAMPYGATRLLSGLVFSLGLILVVVGGAELFTGNNLIVMAWASGRVKTSLLLRNWLIVYLGNFVGSIGIVLLVYFSGQTSFANGKIGETALAIANNKTNLDFGQAIALGILCNVLVCLAIWLSYGGRSAADKILAIVPPITAFVACGFEHSVANMYFIPLGLMIKAGAGESFWTEIGKTAADYPSLNIENFFLQNLIPVTIGNIIGGAVLVGIIYWFIYLRQRSDQ